MRSGNASSGAALTMEEQAAEARLADDLFASLQRVVGFAPRSGERPVANTLMRSQGAVKIDVRRNEKVDMLLATDNKTSQAFIFDASNPTLDVDVLIRSIKRGGGIRAPAF